MLTPSIKKYGYVYALYLQEALQHRGSFFVERFRSLAVLLSFYFLWTALLQNRPSFAGYDRTEMLTYILGMNILRSLIFSSQTYELAWDINQGKISNFLLKPINFVFYTFSRDLAEKSINLVSAIVEVFVLFWVFDLHWKVPEHVWVYPVFVCSLVGAILIYFSIVFAIGCIGFWTAESNGPRFLFELILEFTAGVFFPLSVLSAHVQKIFHYLPSPYLISFPINLFLGKVSFPQAMNGLLIQVIWMGLFCFIASWIWQKGLSRYHASGG